MPSLRLVAPERVGRDAQVVLDRELGQQAAALRDDRDAGAADLLGPPPREVRSPSSTRPPLGRSTPPTASTSDDLPAPFGPSSVVTAPGGCRARRRADDRASAARRRRAPRSAATCRRSLTASLLGAEVGPHHVLVAEDLGRRAEAISLPKSSTAVVVQQPRRGSCRGRRGSRARRSAPGSSGSPG